VDGVGVGGLVAAAGAAALVLALVRGVVRGTRPAKEPRPVPIGDTRMLDGDWLTAGARRYEALLPQIGPSADAAMAAGITRQRCGDPAAALFFYQKAIDLLHADYILHDIGEHSPTPADQAPIDRFLGVLALIREQRPGAPITASVLEVTHRLRTITTACKDAGLDPTRYLDALDRLESIAPDIDVSGIYWRYPASPDENEACS